MIQREALTHTEYGNILMAEFLGATHNQLGEYEMYQVIESIEDGEDEQHVFFPNQMMFDTSWDWIMLVYEKVSEMPAPEMPQGVTVQTPEMDEWSNRIGDITGAIIAVDIDDTWDEIVSFLEWYNKQPKGEA
jgi:GTPase Era involved in 16S rRNA processing